MSQPVRPHMSTVAATPVAAQPQSAVSRDRPWLAAVAVVPILATVYQTLVLTDVLDDVIRKGIDGERTAVAAAVLMLAALAVNSSAD